MAQPAWQTYKGPTVWYLSRTELDEAPNAVAAKAEEGLVAQAISVMLVMPQRKNTPPNHKHTGRNEK